MDDDEMNAEVRDMITLGLLDTDWAVGLNKQEAKKKFTRVLSTEEVPQNNKAEPFEDDEMNAEVRDMITLGLLDANWAVGLNKQEAKKKFTRVLSTEEVPQNNKAEPFEDDEMNAEVRDMITLGLLDANWAVGLNKQEAKKKFTRVLSTEEVPQNNKAEPFEDDEMNAEVRDMITLGLLDANWAVGLNKQEAKKKFTRVLSTEEVPQNNKAEPFEDDEMNAEVRDMITLGLRDANWAVGLNNQETKHKFTQVLSTGEVPQNAEATGLSGKVSKVAIRNNQPNTTAARKPPNLQEKTTNSAPKKIYKLNPLSCEDPVFKEISTDFKNCKFGSKIRSIQEVVNEKQNKSFEDEKKLLQFQFGNEFNLNLKDLYHSTKASSNRICSNGLDLRLSLHGSFGKGIYFSDNVKKCEKYLSEEKESSIYICSVILGDMKEYHNKEYDEQLKTEPEKENGDRYHSVKGNVDGYNEYVIYENRRSLIKYKIILEDTENEDEDIDEEIVKRGSEEKKLEAWKRHMEYMVKSCKHDVEEDEEDEEGIQNIEKVQLEDRWRREMRAGKPLTKLTYDLLRKERKAWKSQNEKSNKIHESPPPPSPPPASDESQMISTENNPVEDGSDKMQILSSFIKKTNCDDTELAMSILMNQNYILENAVNSYEAMMD